MKNCFTCEHCEIPPKEHKQYKDSFGWCMAPRPFFLSDTQPLIKKSEFSECSMHSDK